MMKDFKLLRSNSGRREEPENVPVNVKDSTAAVMTSRTSSESSSRAPFNPIQDPDQNPRPEQDSGAIRSKVERTPTKSSKAAKASDLFTPERPGTAVSARKRFGWAQRNLDSGDFHEIGGSGIRVLPNLTPRIGRNVAAKGGLSYSDSASTHTTPTKSVSKPPTSVFRSKADGGRGGNFAASYKGVPILTGPCTTVVNSVEVPHFDLKEDSSFWMEHNVQVLIRVRPLNSMELSTNGYNRCLKQENAQTITWIGQPETRFTFDHVACETVDQDMLFRMAGLPMVENCLSGYNSCMFAYGQTGSGKTYTMLGEIDDLEDKPSPHRGMTPRIFEFLFARIQVEEETRKDEKLKYSCKCSFLEIYNEQITDLLDPSSSNLLLREDVTKGVYVENLSEFEVHTVSDILRLLIQGSSNRRVAATNMNRESSRSHSVFTCVIESRWEKDSATNFRFARLNLVDLAGSERQKTSGAEGERLKEAANINKSLSTLGHVIMVLVDMAHGKIKHIPYRDSRLTFLLQDSLGGNSKTMIISNVSPSIGSAAETLNTFKFAQRAKLIQNNAVVNEDSTGDCIALQHQIRLLKEELYILKRHPVTRSLSYSSADVEDSQVQNGYVCDVDVQCQHDPFDEEKGTVRLSTKQLKSVEKTLAGALRREKMAEATMKQLEAEKEQLNRLVCQREDETRSSKMMLRFREDKIKKLEALIAGSIHPEAYLLDENRVLCDEIQLLQAKLDKNPEVTRFAYENIRLLNQLRRLEEYYEEGERDLLLDDISKLRDQLLQFLDGPSNQQSNSNYTVEPQEATCTNKENDPLSLKLKDTSKELDECRRILKACLEDNAKLNREIDDLHKMLNTLRSTTIVDNNDLTSKVHNVHIQETAREHAEEILSLQLELDIVNIILKEERTSQDERVSFLNRDLQLANEEFSRKCKQHDEDRIKLQEANCIIADLETQKIMSHNAMEDLRKSNSRYMQLLSEQELELRDLKEQSTSKELKDLQRLSFTNNHDSPLQEKLKRMQASLEVAKRMNMCYQTDRAFQVSNEEEVEEVRRQAEAETAEVIVCMQEELSILQQQFQDSVSKELEVNRNVSMLENKLKVVQENLHNLRVDNEMLRKELQDKDGEIRKSSEEWTLLCSDIEGVLFGGYEVLVDASEELDLISNSFPEKRTWISEQVERVVQIALEKESLIEELRSCLEDANHKRSDVECMLQSLKGATLALTEAHQQEYTEKEKELLGLKTQLKTETSTAEKLGNKVKLLEDQIKKTSLAATVAFVVVNTFAEMNHDNRDALEHNSIRLKESEELISMKVSLLSDQATVIEEAESRNQSLNEDLAECKKACEILRMKVEGIDRENILKTKEKLAELQTGVSTLRSDMNLHVENHPSSIRNQQVPNMNSEGEDGGQMATGIIQDRSRSKQNLEYQSTNTIEKSIDECGTDVTIILLKKEIEAALDSLKEVQAEMGKLREENQLMCKAEKQSRDSLKVFGLQVLNLQSTFNDVEVQSKVKLEALNTRLKAFEQIVQETRSCWCQREESIELEVNEAKLVAAQKSAEVACVLAKFGEAQGTLKKADIMINELMISNQNMKLEIDILKNQEASLNSDRDSLLIEVQSLQSINDISNQKLVHHEEMQASDVMQMNAVVSELEDMVAGIQDAYKETFMLLSSDVCSLKSSQEEPSKFVHSFLEDFWSDIIVKECAVSVLHLCHMGFFHETMTRLKAENGLLQRQLSESNTVVDDLRQHNDRSERELEMSQILKEKLLDDIQTGFDSISRKEEEIGKLNMKVTAFVKQISELKLQEEFTNSNVGALLLDQERSHKEKEAELESQVECLMIDWSAKAFESLVLSSEFEEMANHKADLERESIAYSARLEDFLNEVVLLQIHSNIKEQLLLDEEVEVACLQKKSKEDRENLLLQWNLSNDALKGELNEVKKSEVRLLNQVHALEAEYQELREDLSIKARNLELFSSQISALDKKNQSLQDDIHMLHTSSHGLQDALKKKDDELRRMSFLEIENVSLKCEVQRFEMERDTLKQENVLFREQLMCLKKSREDLLSMWSVTVKSCAKYMETADSFGERLCNIFMQDGDMILERMSDEIYETVDRVIEQFACLECQTEGVVSENLSLQAELLRKDEVLKGLLFDLTLLQESASKSKDQQDEIKEVVTSLGALEVELSEKSCELDEANSNIQILETQLQEKNDLISRLDLSLSQEQESLNLLSTENGELKARIEGAMAAHNSALKELSEKKKIIESLKIEVLEMSNSLGQMNDSNESLRNNLNELARERDHLHIKMDHLQENLEREQARADEFEVIANETHQIAELRKNYADDKEAEVKLLEQSIEELERTVNMLENKVDMVKDEAERQRLRGEELESELQAIKHQMLNVENANAEISRHLDEKEKSIQEAQWNIQVLERDITQKNAEMSQYQVHISELNLHAEAQACEYKQKFKALESMAEQVRPEGHSTHATSTAPNKTEKYATRARGSGSPFKCIGLGLAQQVKSEKDEELLAARTRIEELEALALSRQKEIFSLNSRIACADSMTHDVLRDLLGIKLDMTTYASLLDNQQVQKITEKAQLYSFVSKEKEQEVVKLKKQLNEFIEERRGWLEEIERKQAETIAAQISLEKLRQRDQLHRTENEVLKMENANHKKKVMELEGEVDKLSGQQNIQQRIHHHAKIKDENHMLKSHNEELSTKLRRTEVLLSRCKEELARYRASVGRNPYVDFDEEQRLNTKVKEIEEEKMQLAQELLGLCTSVLKAAGITKHIAHINPSIAEEALEQLKTKITSLDRELQDLKVKNKITSERLRLSELMPPVSPESLKPDENCHTPRRISQAPYFSALDR